MADFELLFLALKRQDIYTDLFTDEQRRALAAARYKARGGAKDAVESLLRSRADIREGVAAALDLHVIRYELKEAHDELSRIVGSLQRNLGPGVKTRWPAVDPVGDVDPELERRMEEGFSEEAVRTTTAKRYGKGYDQIIEEQLAYQSRVRRAETDLKIMQYTYPGRHYRTMEYLAGEVLPAYWERPPVVLLVGAGLLPVPEEIPPELASEPTSPQAIELALILPVGGRLTVVDISEGPLAAVKAKPVRMIFPLDSEKIKEVVYLLGIGEKGIGTKTHLSGQTNRLYHVVTYNDRLADKIKTRRMDIATESYGPEKVDMIVCTHTVGYLQTAPDGSFWKDLNLFKMLGTIRVGGCLVINLHEDGLPSEILNAFGYREVHRDRVDDSLSVFVYKHVRETAFAQKYYDRIEKAQGEARLRTILLKFTETGAPSAWDELPSEELSHYTDAWYFYRRLRLEHEGETAREIASMPARELDGQFEAFRAEATAVKELTALEDSHISSMSPAELLSHLQKIAPLKKGIVSRWAGFVYLCKHPDNTDFEPIILEALGHLALTQEFNGMEAIENHFKDNSTLRLFLDRTLAKYFQPLTVLEQKIGSELKRRTEKNPPLIADLIRDLHRRPEPIDDRDIDWLLGLPPDAAAKAARVSPSAYPGERLIYGPTSCELWRWVLHRLNPGPDDILYDLGSGLGRLVAYAAIATGVRARGIELNPLMAMEADGMGERIGLDNVRFIRANVLDADFGDGTIFYLYHPFAPSTRTKVFEKLKAIAANRPIRIVALWPVSDPFFETQGDWLREVHRGEKVGEMEKFRLMMFESTIHPAQNPKEEEGTEKIDGPPLKEGRGDRSGVATRSVAPALVSPKRRRFNHFLERDDGKNRKTLQTVLKLTGYIASFRGDSPALPALKGQANQLAKKLRLLLRVSAPIDMKAVLETRRIIEDILYDYPNLSDEVKRPLGRARKVLVRAVEKIWQRPAIQGGKPSHGEPARLPPDPSAVGQGHLRENDSIFFPAGIDGPVSVALSVMEEPAVTGRIPVANRDALRVIPRILRQATAARRISTSDVLYVIRLVHELTAHLGNHAESTTLGNLRDELTALLPDPHERVNLTAMGLAETLGWKLTDQQKSRPNSLRQQARFTSRFPERKVVVVHAVMTCSEEGRLAGLELQPDGKNAALFRQKFVRTEVLPRLQNTHPTVQGVVLLTSGAGDVVTTWVRNAEGVFVAASEPERGTPPELSDGPDNPTGEADAEDASELTTEGEEPDQETSASESVVGTGVTGLVASGLVSTAVSPASSLVRVMRK